MPLTDQGDSGVRDDVRSPRVLAGLGVASCVIYAVLAWMSRLFAYGAPAEQRPIPLVLCLFAVLFALYVIAIRSALRCREPATTIFAIAVALRIAMLWSHPILEIDFYRYLWDGHVVRAGVSPYRFSPAEVNRAPADEDDAALVRLRELAQQDPAVTTILHRVHFPELTTVYPPVSQAVFAAAAWCVPRGVPVDVHVLVVRLWMVLFDLATLLLLTRLLRLVSRHDGWALAYGWCPLVIKEFANSGHLDAIAVMFTVAALVKLAQVAARPRAVWGASTLLALAVGAKLYPIVLAPLFLTVAWRHTGRRTLCAAMLLFAGIVLLILWPMLPPKAAPPQTDSGYVEIPPPLPPRLDPRPGSESDTTGHGLSAFLTHWKMNDLLFLVVVENLRPTPQATQERPWFVFTPDSFRTTATREAATRLGIPAAQTPFLLARGLTTGVFVVLACLWAWRSDRADDPAAWLRVAFLTLAWFWLLSPTQNPWYWTWAVPLLPFARSRAWYALALLTMIYYLRFWLVTHWPDPPLLGTPYSGTGFFDFVVVPLEFGPWFAWLAWDAWRSRGRTTGGV